MHFVILINFIQKKLINITNHSRPRVHPIDEKFLGSGVGIIEQQLAHRCLTIATSTTGFLVIGLNASRNFKVNDKADIGAIDSHPKSISRHRNISLTGNKGILSILALLITHPTMIGDAF